MITTDSVEGRTSRASKEPSKLTASRIAEGFNAWSFWGSKSWESGLIGVESWRMLFVKLILITFLPGFDFNLDFSFDTRVSPFNDAEAFASFFFKDLSFAAYARPAAAI